ncbi:Photosystem I P700 chlorophyll a apoprotein A2 [Xylophilus ampelinus]|nr:OmpA family protein [Variovorax sp.]VTY23662.1 Photosystem I P700 chlorophyll a apoprotein A2 [Xylophilus ampelinus]
MNGRRAVAGVLLVLCGLGAAASGSAEYRVQRSAQPLADTSSRFVRQADAPASEMRPAGTGSSFEPAGASSTFAPASAPATRFRLAEVPPERLQRTRELLDTLQARETPQRAIVIDLPADVLFDFDQAELRPDAQASLAKAAELLRSYADAPIAVRGHTDAKGSEAYNDALSLRRAQAVAERLRTAAGGRTIATEGLGKRRPMAPNQHADGSDDPEGRQRNRRVEIVIEPTGTRPAS